MSPLENTSDADRREPAQNPDPKVGLIPVIRPGGPAASERKSQPERRSQLEGRSQPEGKSQPEREAVPGKAPKASKAPKSPKGVPGLPTGPAGVGLRSTRPKPPPPTTSVIQTPAKGTSGGLGSGQTAPASQPQRKPRARKTVPGNHHPGSAGAQRQDRSSAAAKRMLRRLVQGETPPTQAMSMTSPPASIMFQLVP